MIVTTVVEISVFVTGTSVTLEGMTVLLEELTPKEDEMGVFVERYVEETLELLQ